MRSLSTTKIRYREVSTTTTTNASAYIYNPRSSDAESSSVAAATAAATAALLNEITSTPLDDLLSTAWVRHHLYMIGSDIIRLKLYQKLTHLIDMGGGPLVKNLVYDLTTFLKRELGSNNRHSSSPPPATSTAQQLRDLVFFGPNIASINGDSIYSRYNIPDFRWLYITVGYMVLSQRKELTDDMTDQILQIYINSRNAPYLSGGSGTGTSVDREKGIILDLAKDYYEQVPINYKKLYTKNVTRYITLHETKDYHIVLPLLPRLHNKENLVKSLIHKELYRAWIDPEHQFSQRLTSLGVDVEDSSTKATLKYELSFLDGLGDLYLARESSNLLYKFGGVPPTTENNDDSFGTRTYNQLRIILSTNTLLSKLTVAYKLHQGLGDKRVYRLLRKSYVPNMHRWEDPEFDDEDSKRYEQEFLADYFEQYIGALYLEQPEVAQNWILQIYENILLLISDVHKLTGKDKKKCSQPYNYRAWSVDVIGRNIWR